MRKNGEKLKGDEGIKTVKTVTDEFERISIPPASRSSCAPHRGRETRGALSYRRGLCAQQWRCLGQEIVVPTVDPAYWPVLQVVLTNPSTELSYQVASRSFLQGGGRPSLPSVDLFFFPFSVGHVCQSYTPGSGTRAAGRY